MNRCILNVTGLVVCANSGNWWPPTSGPDSERFGRTAAREDARPTTSSIRSILFIPVNPCETEEQKEMELGDPFYGKAPPPSGGTQSANQMPLSCALNSSHVPPFGNVARLWSFASGETSRTVGTLNTPYFRAIIPP